MANAFSNWTQEMVDAHNARIASGKVERKPHQKASDVEVITEYRRTQSVWQTAKKFGMCGQSIWERLKSLGVVLRGNEYTDAEKKLIEEFYRTGFKDGELQLFCDKHGFQKPNVSRYARHKLGLTSMSRTHSDAVKAENSKKFKKWHSENEHPRGMLGKKHTPETLAKVSKTSKAQWDAMTEDERVLRTQKMMLCKAAKNGGVLPLPRAHGSWKAAWVQIGGKRFFSRSRWEVAYACYLELLKDSGNIQEWEYEAMTFWFEGIKRGTNNYTPDFRITIEDNWEFHEVKGWMDDRSKTKIERMAKYHPSIKLIVRDGSWFKANRNALAIAQQSIKHVIETKDQNAPGAMIEIREAVL